MSRRGTTNFYGIWMGERREADSFIARVELLLAQENIASVEQLASSFGKRAQTKMI